MIYVVGLIAVILGVALDQYTKYLATMHLQDTPFPIIDGVFQLSYVENHGAAFGMFQNQQTLFLIIGILTVAILTFVYIRMPKTRHYLLFRICMISIVTGAIGNMIDRIRMKYVVDFLDFVLIKFPVFNVADIFATVAAFGMIFLLLFYYSDEDLDILFRKVFPKRHKKGTQE